MPTDSWAALAPDFVVLGVVVAVMIFEVLRADARWSRGTVLAGLLAALALLWRQLTQDTLVSVIDGELVVDTLAVAGKGVVLCCGLGVAMAFPRYEPSHKFWLLLASSLFGGLVVLGSQSFATLFLGIEVLSLPSFALIVQGQARTAASEGAFKYLVLSSVASALLLFGASLAYGLTGSLDLDAFTALLFGPHPQAQAATLLVLSGLFLKAAVFPFHAWAPDAYAAARLPALALMASVVKAVVVLALVRIIGAHPLQPAATALIVVLAIVSIGFGNLAALRQARFKRLLAYSSIAHAGYMIFALTDLTGSRASDLLWYTLFYGLASVLACASFAALCPGDDDRLERLDGQFAQRPVASVVLALAMLSLAGVPPLPGFFAKVFVFKSVIASGHAAAATIAFVGSFLGLAYYVGIALRPFRTAADAGTSPVTGETRHRDKMAA